MEDAKEGKLNFSELKDNMLSCEGSTAHFITTMASPYTNSLGGPIYEGWVKQYRKIDWIKINSMKIFLVDTSKRLKGMILQQRI